MCRHDLEDAKQVFKDSLQNLEKTRHAEYYLKNKDRIDARQKAYDAVRKEQKKAYLHEYYLKNKERLNAMNRERYAEDREKRNAESLAYYYEHRDEINKRRKERRMKEAIYGNDKS
jgi:hypothetical protein